MNTIVAVDKNYGIGRNGELLFSIPEDMRYFREMTFGKTVIMGRRTLQSLPEGKPLKNRRNIVFSRDRRMTVSGAQMVHSVSELASLLGEATDAFVIGGEAIYGELLNYCRRAYITMVDADGKADRFFPNVEQMKNWTLESASEWKEHDGLRYQFRVYLNGDVTPAEIYNACGYMTEYCRL